MGHFELAFVTACAGSDERHFVKVEHMTVQILLRSHPLRQEMLDQRHQLRLLDLCPKILDEDRAIERKCVLGEVDMVKIDMKTLLIGFTAEALNDLITELSGERGDIFGAFTQGGQFDVDTEKGASFATERGVADGDDLGVGFLRCLKQFRKCFACFDVIDEEIRLFPKKGIEFFILCVQQWRFRQNQPCKRMPARSRFTGNKGMKP